MYFVLAFLAAVGAGAVETDTKIIPLPIYATLPNEGPTYGLMPVFMLVEDPTERTRSIIAPSVSWNSIIRYTATFRFYNYPSDTESLTLIPSYSSNVNRGLTFQYMSLPKAPGRYTFEATMFARRSMFYRFFGLGPDSKTGDESSYTRLAYDPSARLGYNLDRHWNVGLKVGLERNLVEEIGVSFLPLVTEKFPGTPGLGGSTVLYEQISLRYDDRVAREYSTAGFANEVGAAVAQGLSGTDAFGVFFWEARQLWRHNSFLNGGARVYWRYAAGGAIPFYHQSSLGGSYRLRGFTEDRFIDKGAWTAEIEQRLVALRTRIYGVTADWRIDPFVAVGQVYQGAHDIFRHVRVTAGLGFRAFVHPNVLGRVDTAVGGEGIKVYVELGYPF